VDLFETTGERVLVIGARGALGRVIAQVFEAAGWEVIRGGRAAERTGGWRRIDLDREWTIRPAVAGMDVVVNTVPHARLAIERLVLHTGGLLLTTGTDAATGVATDAVTDAHSQLNSGSHTPIGTVVLGAVHTISSADDAVDAAHATLVIAHALQDARARGQLRPGVFATEDLVELGTLTLEAGEISLEDDPLTNP
jgi:NADPH:quinone reductase-like Zn-dependent oxidoreductase